jgi:hypothetical protein
VVVINRRAIENYFTSPRSRPPPKLSVTQTADVYDVDATITVAA